MTKNQKVVEAPVVNTPVVEKVAKVGVGSFCKDKILNSVWTNAEILEEVKRVFPSAKTTYACIAWYRSDLRSKGLIGPKTSTKKVVETQAEVV